MIPAPFFTQENFITGKTQTDIFSTLLSDRNIMLFDQINDNVACVVISQLMFLAAVDATADITLYINSPGGVVSAGLAIFDTIRRLQCDVATVCIGRAASMGALLLSAGAKGKRRATANSSIMIHQALGGIQFGQASDVQIQAENLLYTKKQLSVLLAKTTGRTLAEIERDTERDCYMTPEKALAYGIIDEVMKDGEG